MGYATQNFSRAYDLLFLVETFALGDLSGGRWEEAIIVKGSTPKEAFAEALEVVAKQGYAFTTKITACNGRGEPIY